jgi:hypothetical protein
LKEVRSNMTDCCCFWCCCCFWWGCCCCCCKDGWTLTMTGSSIRKSNKVATHSSQFYRCENLKIKMRYNLMYRSMKIKQPIFQFNNTFDAVVYALMACIFNRIISVSFFRFWFWISWKRKHQFVLKAKKI